MVPREVAAVDQETRLYVPHLLSLGAAIDQQTLLAALSQVMVTCAWHHPEWVSAVLQSVHRVHLIVDEQ